MKAPLPSALLLVILTAAAAQAQPLWPEVRYSETVPTMESVLGYAPGSEITSAAATRRYFETLAAARPTQVRLIDYGSSWQGRTLFFAVIGSRERMAGLEQHADDMARLADPDTPAAAADELLAQLPASVWLAYSVHGNEISPTDAALATAYHLLAAEEDPVVDQILADALVFLAPLQNPDGRERFRASFEQARGLEPQADRQAAEHDEPWPSGRMNHYLFDLNRDWIVLTQPETRGHVAALRQWRPLVFADLHEMGPDQTYYFAPDAVPYNPHLAASQRSALELFGRNNARWFDQFGIDYFTREIFDAFYPGYGASWPAYYGAIAMTYEQGSTRGLVVRRRDGSELSYRDSVRHHFVSTVATAQAAAMHRSRLLKDFRDYQISAVAEGRRGVRSYIISAAGDASGADKLAGVLTRQGVQLTRSDDAFSACGQEYPAGSYVASLAQPAKRLLRTLLDPQVDMAPDFLAEQERRRRANLNDEIYDVTGWSLPLMFGLNVTGCERNVEVTGTSAGSELIRPGQLSNAGASVAYLAPGGSSATTRLLAAAQRQELKAKGSDAPFVLEDRRYPSGTLIFPVADNPVDLGPRLATLARHTGAEVVGVSDSWVTDGPNFGSQKVVPLTPPRIALAWDTPTSPYSAGAARYVIERQFGYPVTPIRVSRLGSADLSDYSVLILPETRGAGYPERLREPLAAWTRAGGTLIALGSAVPFLAGGEEPLLALKREAAYRRGPQGKDDEAPVPGTRLTSPAALSEAITPDREPPDGVSGVLLKAAVSPDHWLAAGVPENVNVLYRGNRIFAPLTADQGVTIASYAGPEDLLASGYLWEENRQQLAYKPFLAARALGRGHVIGFTADPNVRAYLDGLNGLFMNAVLRGPGHSRKVR
ncbi:MAG: M14 family metallopeptidase [Pseudomonadota bacterium]